jgi:hypothetical protein
MISQPKKRARTANKWDQNCPKKCRSSFGSLVGLSALLLLLFASAVITEIDAGSVSTNAFSPGVNVADNSLEPLGYCNSLEKDEAFECFRYMATTVSETMKENAILVSKNTELVNKDAALVNENTAMASTIVMLESSLEIGCTDQRTHLKPMGVVDKQSDGARLQDPSPTLLPCCNTLSIVHFFHRVSTTLPRPHTPVDVLRVDQHHTAPTTPSEPSDIRIFHGSAASFTEPSAINLLTDVESTHEPFGTHNDEPGKNPILPSLVLPLFTSSLSPCLHLSSPSQHDRCEAPFAIAVPA